MRNLERDTQHTSKKNIYGNAIAQSCIESNNEQPVERDISYNVKRFWTWQARISRGKLRDSSSATARTGKNEIAQFRNGSMGEMVHRQIARVSEVG